MRWFITRCPARVRPVMWRGQTLAEAGGIECHGVGFLMNPSPTLWTTSVRSFRQRVRLGHGGCRRSKLLVCTNTLLVWCAVGSRGGSEDVARESFYRRR